MAAKTVSCSGLLAVAYLLSICIGVSVDASLRLGAFNLRIFGQKKLENDAAVDTIVKIILRYDLVLLQEIRDSSETAIVTLLDRVNSVAQEKYKMEVSERLGRTTSKEQYAYMYRSNKVELVSSYLASDSDDVFEREPFVALFQSSLTAAERFAVVGIHTRPDSAWEEIDHLVQVDEDVQQRLNVQDVIITGDFNGDCSFVPNYRWESVRLRTNPRYHWLLGDDVDTTVFNTDCAYDRFVIAGAGLESAILPCSATVFKFDAEYGLNQSQAVEVSDHYPIELTFLPSEFRTSRESLFIGAFNIPTFGVTKAGKDHVMDILSRIVKRYDLILIQGIRDQSGGAIEQLLDWCNRDNTDAFQSIVSERVGPSRRMQQYAYFYRPSQVELISSAVYDDTADVFQREPFMAHFRSRNSYLKDFVIAGLESSSSQAPEEIDALVDTVSAIRQQYGTENVMFVGDLAADCAYVPNSRWEDIRLKTDSRFCWLVDDDADTTVTDNTDCAYDRIVITGDEFKRGVLPHSASVFRFDQAYGLNQTVAMAVSSHYPVEVRLRTLDSDVGYTRIPTTTSRGRATHQVGEFLVNSITTVMAFII
ncbi:uncharacterized protein [Diadema antillarum]|uniref:uncharacterized protein n=1 Tax=Diadema antillarum TaxID=105358 RepID=UPI003A8A1619